MGYEGLPTGTGGVKIHWQDKKIPTTIQEWQKGGETSSEEEGISWGFRQVRIRALLSRECGQPFWNSNVMRRRKNWRGKLFLTTRQEIPYGGSRKN